MKRLLLALALTACASVPTTSDPAARCLANGPCVVVQAENQFFEPATIYLNGARAAELSAGESRVVWMPESRLVEGRCLYASVLLRQSGRQMNAARECLTAGGYYTLSVAVGGHLWVVPRR